MFGVKEHALRKKLLQERQLTLEKSNRHDMTKVEKQVHSISKISPQLQIGMKYTLWNIATEKNQEYWKTQEIQGVSKHTNIVEESRVQVGKTPA